MNFLAAIHGSYEDHRKHNLAIHSLGEESTACGLFEPLEYELKASHTLENRPRNRYVR